MNKVQIASLQSAVEVIKATGKIRTVQHLERQINTLKRRQRNLSTGSPAVADAFKRLRIAEDIEFKEKMHIQHQMKALKQNAQVAKDDKNPRPRHYRK